MSELVLNELRTLNRRIDRLEDRVLRQSIGVTEAAEILGVTAREIRRRAKAGELPVIAGPNKWRFWYADVVGQRESVLKDTGQK